MLVKYTFRSEIKNILLKYMLSGTISSGDRLSLPTIAKDLDVSVTPVREALTQLTETGIVTYKANRGFFVTELSEKDALEIYELIALLEGEAVKNNKYNQKHISQLKQINRDFKKAKDPKKKLLLDRTFHQKLIEGYSNEYAIKIIEDIRIRVFLYEHEFMTSSDDGKSAEMHDRIINFIAAGNKANAIKEIKYNWDLSITKILETYNQ